MIPTDAAAGIPVYEMSAAGLDQPAGGHDVETCPTCGGSGVIQASGQPSTEAPGQSQNPQNADAANEMYNMLIGQGVSQEDAFNQVSQYLDKSDASSPGMTVDPEDQAWYNGLEARGNSMLQPDNEMLADFENDTRNDANFDKNLAAVDLMQQAKNDTRPAEPDPDMKFNYPQGTMDMGLGQQSPSENFDVAEQYNETPVMASQVPLFEADDPSNQQRYLQRKAALAALRGRI